jgi:hypothetical protein
LHADYTVTWTKGNDMVRTTVEHSAHNTEIAPDDERSMPAGDIAAAWLDQFSEELTLADLTRWLGEVG